MLFTWSSEGGDLGVYKSVINVHTIGGLADPRTTLSQCRLRRRLKIRAAEKCFESERWAHMHAHAALTLEDRERQRAPCPSC